MDDFPWAYAAMILIAFVGWVYRRIQEVQEIRRQRAAAKRAQSEAQRKPKAIPPPSPYRWSPETQPAPAAVATVDEEIETPRTFRGYFEMLRTEVAAETDVPPHSPPAAPPPLPVAAPKAEALRRSVATVAAPVRDHFRASPVSSVTRSLRRGESLRDAIILREILDKPVALRD